MTPNWFRSVWDVSELLATRAAGVQRIVVGPNVNPLNAFSQAEFPALLRNAAVTSLEFYRGGSVLGAPFLVTTRQMLEQIWKASN